MNRYSPGVVADSEILSRFVFSPMFIHAKNGTIKPNIFAHTFTVGCSIQREDVASDTEIREFVASIVNADRSWHSVLQAKCEELRAALCPNSEERAFYIYDTANKKNPAHGEICQSKDFEEADKVELRHILFSAFNSGKPVAASAYRSGVITTTRSATPSAA